MVVINCWLLLLTNLLSKYPYSPTGVAGSQRKLKSLQEGWKTIPLQNMSMSGIQCLLMCNFFVTNLMSTITKQNYVLVGFEHICLPRESRFLYFFSFLVLLLDDKAIELLFWFLHPSSSLFKVLGTMKS